MGPETDPGFKTQDEPLSCLQGLLLNTDRAQLCVGGAVSGWSR